MQLRLPGFLRLITSLESIAASLAILADIEREKWRRANEAKQPRQTEFSVLDMDEANRRFRIVEEAHAAGVDPQL